MANKLFTGLGNYAKGNVAHQYIMDLNIADNAKLDAVYRSNAAEINQYFGEIDPAKLYQALKANKNDGPSFLDNKYLWLLLGLALGALTIKMLSK